MKYNKRIIRAAWNVNENFYNTWIINELWFLSCLTIKVMTMISKLEAVSERKASCWSNCWRMKGLMMLMTRKIITRHTNLMKIRYWEAWDLRALHLLLRKRDLVMAKIVPAKGAIQMELWVLPIQWFFSFLAPI